MNLYARTSIVIVVLIACAVSVIAQGEKKKRSFDHTADIVSEYNKDKNETKVELRQFYIKMAKAGSEHVLNLTAYYTYPGKTPTKPAEVVLGFTSASYNRERKFQDNRELKAELGGKQESLGTMELIVSRIDSRFYKEVLGIFLPWDVFLKFTDSKKESMGMSIGNVRFELDRAHLEALRDLASRVE